jgi:hypothetical protein
MPCLIGADGSPPLIPSVVSEGPPPLIPFVTIGATASRRLSKMVMEYTPF